MIVAALPCPPLGMTGTREEYGTDITFTSHAFMMNVLLHTAYKCNADVQARHTDMMRDAERKLLVEIDSLQLPLYPPDAYAAFCCYMRGILHASPWVHADTRFTPLEHVCRGDVVHRSTCDHARAHDVLYGERGRSDYENKDYMCLVACYAYRIHNDVHSGC